MSEIIWCGTCGSKPSVPSDPWMRCENCIRKYEEGERRAKRMLEDCRGSTNVEEQRIRYAQGQFDDQTLDCEPKIPTVEGGESSEVLNAGERNETDQSCCCPSGDHCGSAGRTVHSGDPVGQPHHGTTDQDRDSLGDSGTRPRSDGGEGT